MASAIANIQWSHSVATMGREAESDQNMFSPRVDCIITNVTNKFHILLWVVRDVVFACCANVSWSCIFDINGMLRV